MAILVQKGDLNPQIFTNDDTNNLGGIGVRDATAAIPGIATKASLTANPDGSFTYSNSPVPAENVTIPAPVEPDLVAMYGNDGVTLLGHMIAP